MMLMFLYQNNEIINEKPKKIVNFVTFYLFRQVLLEFKICVKISIILSECKIKQNNF